MFYSPLRYPGGKNKLSKFIAQLCLENNINSNYVEPYAWGASVALYLLIEKKVKTITINDFDLSIYAFWYSVLNNTDSLCYLIEQTEINIENWRKAKEIQRNKNNADYLSLWFSTLYLNRTNISGIINAWVIGGIEQNWNYKMNCRFNKIDIIKKIRKIAEHKDNIVLYNMDAVELIRMLKKKNTTNMIFYFDPPYYLKGSSLYLNHYNEQQHIDVANEIMKIKNKSWIVSYDNTPEIESIYSWVPSTHIKKYSFNHSAYKAKEGKEILFFSENISSSILKKSFVLLPSSNANNSI